MNQSSPFIFVLYLSDASNNEGNGRMKGEILMTNHFVLFHKIFSTLSKTKIHYFGHNYLFCQQRLITSITQKLNNCRLVKGEYDMCPLSFTKQVLKLFNQPHVTVRYRDQMNTNLTLHPS